MAVKPRGAALSVDAPGAKSSEHRGGVGCQLVCIQNVSDWEHNIHDKCAIPGIYLSFRPKLLHDVKQAPISETGSRDEIATGRLSPATGSTRCRWRNASVSRARRSARRAAAIGGGMVELRPNRGAIVSAPDRRADGMFE